jgi:N-acetylated-alpha-linked acidic dipeptidase
MSHQVADRDAFAAAVDAGDVAPDAANEAVKTPSRTLTRLYLTTEGRYEQDPATGREPLPRYAVAETFPVVDEETAGFVRTQLRSEQNTVVGERRRARAAIPEVDA